MTIDSENYRLALRLQKEGKYSEALETARRISNPIFRAAILIDSGDDARKPALIREGIRLFENALTQNNVNVSRASLLYNIANGYSAIFHSRLVNGAKLVAPNDHDLRKAKQCYRQALAETKGTSPLLRTQIFVNFGNCLSRLGRTFEAIEAFSAALELEPQNGMAAGNLGIELDRVAAITGRYLHHYLLEAHQAITVALSSKSHLSYGGQDAAIGFREKLNELQERIDAHEHKPQPLKKLSLSNQRSTRDRYILFCIRHRLFLNAWAGDQYVMPAISDEIEYGSITVRLSQVQMVSELLRILNEIKEAYSTARYLFYLSQLGSGVHDKISSLTTYRTTQGEEINGLQLGLCKSAYTRAFDVLDKVARIVNLYFKIGKTRDYFWNVLAEKQSWGPEHQIRFGVKPNVIATHNYSLYALADLCIDYFESEHVEFKSMDARRNRITHDYLAVIESATNVESESSVTVSELYRQTLATLKLAKFATLYAVSAVHIAEEQRGRPEDAKNMRYHESSGVSGKLLRKIVRKKR